MPDLISKLIMSKKNRKKLFTVTSVREKKNYGKFAVMSEHEIVHYEPVFFVLPSGRFVARAEGKGYNPTRQNNNFLTIT